MKVVIPPIKIPRRKVYHYQKGDRGYVETSEGYLPIRQLGQKMGYEIPTFQIEHDSGDKKAYKYNSGFLYLRGYSS